MPSLVTVPTLNVDDAISDAFVDSLTADVNYLSIAGADLASAAAIVPTNEFHIVTGVTQIDNLNHAAPVKGQQVRLLFTGAGLTIRNNGGGAGNIRTMSGGNRTVATNEVVLFTYDGALWREGTQTSTRQFCKIRHTAVVSAGNNGNGTGAAVFHPFDTDVWDDFGMHDPVTNNSRVVIPEAGVWGYMGRFTIQANVAGFRSVTVRVNGTTSLDVMTGKDPNTSTDTDFMVVGAAKLSAADYLELGVYQNSGGALNINVGGPQESPIFEVWRIG